MKNFAAIMTVSILASLSSCRSRSSGDASQVKNIEPGPGFSLIVAPVDVPTIGGSSALEVKIEMLTEAMCETVCPEITKETFVSNGTYHINLKNAGPREGNTQAVALVSHTVVLTPDVKRLAITTYKADVYNMPIDAQTSVVQAHGSLITNAVAIGGESSGLAFKAMDSQYQLDLTDHETQLLTDKHGGMNVNLKGKLVKKTSGVETKSTNVLQVEQITVE